MSAVMVGFFGSQLYLFMASSLLRSVQRQIIGGGGKKGNDFVNCLPIAVIPSTMEKFKDKYRIATARLQNWDYSAAGSYFVTICTKNRECLLGEIRQQKMYLSDIGKIAETQWLQTIELRPNMNLELGEYVVMPNHLHGIVIIGDNEFNMKRRDAMHCVSKTNSNCTDGMHSVSTPPTNQFGPQSKNLASIIRGFKSSVTAHAKKIEHQNFGWQTRYHDHIIRNTQSFENIQNYIINNPRNWAKDKFYN